MSTMQIAFLVLGAIATFVFVAGYFKGARIALASYDDDSLEVDNSGDVRNYWVPIGFTVLAAITVIGLMGVHPYFIYLGPLAAVFSAFGIGSAFFIDRDSQMPSKQD